MNEAEMVAKVEEFVQEQGIDNPLVLAHGIGMVEAFRLCNPNSENIELKRIKLRYSFKLMQLVDNF